MKTRISLFVFLLWFFSAPLFAQNPLVGTWELKDDTLYSVKNYYSYPLDDVHGVQEGR
jgi:hypothetical protein